MSVCMSIFLPFCLSSHINPFASVFLSAESAPSLANVKKCNGEGRRQMQQDYTIYLDKLSKITALKSALRLCVFGFMLAGRTRRW
jgi:hypothetical protein